MNKEDNVTLRHIVEPNRVAKGENLRGVMSAFPGRHRKELPGFVGVSLYAGGEDMIGMRAIDRRYQPGIDLFITAARPSTPDYRRIRCCTVHVTPSALARESAAACAGTASAHS